MKILYKNLLEIIIKTNWISEPMIFKLVKYADVKTHFHIMFHILWIKIISLNPKYLILYHAEKPFALPLVCLFVSMLVSGV